MDQHKNFATSLVATAPSPATSGTSLVVTSGEGTRFPTPPFNAVICPAGAMATPANAEVVRVSAVSTDTLTIARAQESSSARTVVVGDRIYAGPTARSLTDIETSSVVTYTGRKILSLYPSLYWPLDARHKATDQSGNGRDGTAGGGVTLGGFAGSPVVSDPISTDLDGTDDKVTSSYNPFTNGTSRTFCGWANRDTDTGFDVLFGSSVDYDAAVFLRIAVGGYMEWFTATSPVQWMSAGTWPGTAQWVHWAFTFNESTNVAELYINGVSIGTRTAADAYNASPGNFQIGVYFTSSNPFDGKMAHVAVFERILTAGEIASLAVA